MVFEKINQDQWSRREYFEHYFSNIPCTYSLTSKLDITRLKNNGQKLFPSLLFHLTTIVNRHQEFRTAINEQGELGIYSDMLPCYTVFHKDTETFSNVWTEYANDLEMFCRSYERDIERYGNCQGFVAKPNIPANSFTVSVLPWVTFEGFNLNLQKGFEYLKPIFTLGKFYFENDKILMPISIQVHHAVCDGFHVCRFLNELQTEINN